MEPTSTSLFEREMRHQIASAEASVLDALGTGDPILIESARGHLDGLVDLARRNGLTVKPLIIDEAPLTIDIAEQPAAS